MTTRMFIPALDALVFGHPPGSTLGRLVPFQNSLPCFRWEAAIEKAGDPSRIVAAMTLSSAADAEAATEADRGPDRQFGAGPYKRLLIVEDDASTRESLEGYFVHQGCMVRSAESVPEARHTLAEGYEPDVIISDWQLGGPETGAQLVREIKRFKPDSKAYLVSGHSRQEVLEDLGELEIAGFFSKPIPFAELAEAIGL